MQQGSQPRPITAAHHTSNGTELPTQAIERPTTWSGHQWLLTASWLPCTLPVTAGWRQGAFDSPLLPWCPAQYLLRSFMNLPAIELSLLTAPPAICFTCSRSCLACSRATTPAAPAVPTPGAAGHAQIRLDSRDRARHASNCAGSRAHGGDRAANASSTEARAHMQRRSSGQMLCCCLSAPAIHWAPECLVLAAAGNQQRCT